MLEFWEGPDSPLFKKVFASRKPMVLYCGIGWRSALATATLQDIGVQEVGHVAGGFTAWRSRGYDMTKAKVR